MSQNKKGILTLILIFLIALSCLLFFGIGNGEKNQIQISSFIFIIIDELIAYGVVLGVHNKNSNTFSIAGLVSLTSIYILISLVVNILLKFIFTTLKGILVFNFTILLLYLLIAMIILFFKKEKK